MKPSTLTSAVVDTLILYLNWIEPAFEELQYFCRGSLIWSSTALSVNEWLSVTALINCHRCEGSRQCLLTVLRCGGLDQLSTAVHIRSDWRCWVGFVLTEVRGGWILPPQFLLAPDWGWSLSLYAVYVLTFHMALSCNSSWSPLEGLMSSTLSHFHAFRAHVIRLDLSRQSRIISPLR